VTKALMAMKYFPMWYQYFQRQPILPEAMIKGNEECLGAFFTLGKKAGTASFRKKPWIEYVRCYSIEDTPRTAASYYRSMTLDAPHWATLAGRRFTMPSLYIYGNEDTVIIPANITHLEDCFDSIKVEQIKAEHFLQEEKPQEVAALMNGFLKES